MELEPYSAPDVPQPYAEPPEWPGWNGGQQYRDEFATTVTEVPGMQVPDAVRERMRKAGSGPQARKEGVAIAREMLAEVRSDVAGAYVMPPLERYELALEVIDGFR